VVFGANLVFEINKVDADPPTNCFPIQADFPEFGRFGTFIAIGRYDPKCDYPGIDKREDEVSRRYLPHEFIKRVSCAVGIALRRPEIAARDLLPICLVLVYPPVAHGKPISRWARFFTECQKE
jgi:hypothetical protein